MQIKVKHKMTFDTPDTIFNADFNRGNRKNKTMIRSFYGNKQNSPFQYLSSSDQKQIKTIVEGKIQELHLKMKAFFCQQRQSHLEQIAPQMEQLKKLIQELKIELSRPKSMEQIELQKQNLLKRKVILLKQMENINKKIKLNKSTFYDLKFQWQQVVRQLNNGRATIQKYQKKLRQIDDIPSNENNNEQQDKNNNLSRIINLSMICISDQNQKKQTNSARIQMIKQTQQYPIHLTQIQQKQTSQQTKFKLPVIKNAKNKNLRYLSDISKTPDSFTSQKFRMEKNNKLADISNKMKKKVNKHTESIIKDQKQANMKNMSNQNKYSYFLDKNVTKQINLLEKITNKQKTLKVHKSSKAARYQFDLNMQLKKQKNLANKQKWKKLDQLFYRLQGNQNTRSSFTKSYQGEVTISQSNKKLQTQNLQIQNSISVIQQNLIEQLRKYQYSQFDQKGYHEGLKDKTHQIKIDYKKILKNYSADQFFNQMIKKKTIQKTMDQLFLKIESKV